MPSRKKVDLGTTSDRLEFAKAITNLTSKQSAFADAVKALQEFNTDTLKKYDLEIESKKIDLEEIEKNIKKIKKDAEIEADQYIAEYRYDAVKSILKDRNERPIDIDEFNRLNKEINELVSKHEQELIDLKTKEKESSKKALNAALKNMELSHKAEIATLTAENAQMEHEIKNLKEVIDNLRTELSAQRQLTKDVAEASRNNQPSYIQMPHNK